MHPAPSVILFTVLSAMGFGLLAFLGLGYPEPSGWMAFFHWGLGYALAVSGLLFSTFHLGHPERAIKAFSQWRSSWLSREGVTSVATLLLMAPVALSDWLGLGWSRLFGDIGALMAVLTVFTTSMIYTQLKTVPRWNHWSTPLSFESFALVGGAMLAGHLMIAFYGLIWLGCLVAYVFIDGEGRFARRGQTMGTATGLDRIGTVSVFEQPHTSPNYLMKEMIYVVARRHLPKIRALSLMLLSVLPALLVLLAMTGGMPKVPALILAILSHLIGALAQRWLFFAQAEHVVGLFYGQR